MADNTNEQTETNEPKKISIIGTNTRYQLKRVTQDKVDKKRTTIMLTPELIENQFTSITELYNNIHTNQSSRENTNTNIISNKLFIKEITNKISGYRQQDIIKKLYDSAKFVSLSQVIEKIYNCKMNCYYCCEQTLVLYEMVRQKKQWSLDRINNDLGHNSDNVVIACLECNLQRKRKSKDAFVFTKQLTITRCEK
jgi:hypothetical protein